MTGDARTLTRGCFLLVLSFLAVSHRARGHIQRSRGSAGQGRRASTAHRVEERLGRFAG